MLLVLLLDLCRTVFIFRNLNIHIMLLFVALVDVSRMTDLSLISPILVFFRNLADQLLSFLWDPSKPLRSAKLQLLNLVGAPFFGNCIFCEDQGTRLGANIIKLWHDNFKNVCPNIIICRHKVFWFFSSWKPTCEINNTAHDASWVRMMHHEYSWRINAQNSGMHTPA